MKRPIACKTTCYNRQMVPDRRQVERENLIVGLQDLNLRLRPRDLSRALALAPALVSARQLLLRRRLMTGVRNTAGSGRHSFGKGKCVYSAVLLEHRAGKPVVFFPLAVEIEQGCSDGYSAALCTSSNGGRAHLFG
jgi:hypothetical protein